MITRLSAIPKDVMECDFVIITHRLPKTDYVFENDSIYKIKGNNLKEVSVYISGRCKVAKINGKAISFMKLKAKRLPCVDIYVKNIKKYPF